MKGYACLALLALVASMADAMNGMVGGDGGPKLGGWTKAKNPTKLKKKLIQAMTKSNDNYAKGVTTRLCVTQVKFVDQQVVAGTNYLFHIMGCDVGSAFERVGNCGGPDANCAPRSYSVKVFEQPWTDTLQVTEIKLEDVKYGEVSEDEKHLIDEWIKREHRNEFGDPEGTTYTGGTPLFNETTAKVIDVIDYIISKYPNRPWLPSEAPMMGMVRSSPLNLAAEQDAKRAQQDAFKDTYTISLGVFGTFALAIGAVAFVKARRMETRRFTYDSVNRSEM